METNQTEPFMSTYLHRKGRKLGLPIAGNFELTARCNFNCPMCYVHLTEEQVRQRGQELTARQWLSIAAEAQKQGMIFVLLTGGEPLIRKDFFEIYDGMKKLGLLISINTNGSLLKGEILQRFLQDPPSRFNITLYGGSNETYQGMCGQPAFHQVVENIRALRSAGVQVSLNLSITPYNHQDIEKIHAISQELGVNVKGSAYMYPPVRVNGQTGCGNRLSPEESGACQALWDSCRLAPEQFRQRALSMKNLEAVEDAGCPAEADEGVRCRAGHTSFWMTWDGKMLPCGMIPNPAAYPLQEGFDAAWQKIRQATAAIRLPAECTSCPKRPVCPVCAAVCLTETGSFDKVPEYVCRQTEEIIRQTWKLSQERSGLDAD